MLEDISTTLIDTTISVNSNDNECFICYEDMNDADKVMTLPCCKKELHTKCLEKWHSEMEGECSCPHCMTVLYTKISQEDNEQIRLIDINTDNRSNNVVSNCEKYYEMCIYNCMIIIGCYLFIGTILLLITSEI